MIDFHSHILPGMDDGSRSVEESIRMLHVSYEQGVRWMIATPHFYAEKETPKSFLRRRRNAWKQLRENRDEQTPKILLGAEVYYYRGITKSADIELLCIAGTNIVLLEMPFRKWSEGMLADILELINVWKLTVVLAHVDRYLAKQDRGTWDYLADNGVLFQLNASALSSGIIAMRNSMKMIQKDQIAVLGSDCHNLTNRKPNLDKAFSLIEKKAGRTRVLQLQRNARELLHSCRNTSE